MVLAAEMNEKAKSINAHAAAERFFSRTKNRAGTQDYIRQLALFAVLPDQFLLLEFAETVGVKPFLRVVFERASFVKQRAPLHFQIGIDRERTDVHESRGTAVLQESVHQITRRQGGIHERAGKGFFHAGREVIDDRDSIRRLLTILARQQIAGDDLGGFASRIFREHLFQAIQFAGWPHETAHIAEAVFQQDFYHLGTNEAIGAGDQYAVGG